MTELHRFIEILQKESESLYFRCGMALLALMLIWAFGQWQMGPLPLSASPHDDIGFIDAGYRVLSGQVPHNDFYVGLGPAFSYIYAVGVALVGPNVRAIIASNLLMMGIITPLAWMVSSKRMTPVLALTFSVMVMTLTSGVVPLGWNAGASDYAMSYNRHGYGIMLCICIASFFPKKRDSSLADAAEEIVIGALLALLLLLKINFFVVCLGALLLSPVFIRFRARRAALTCVGFLLPLLFFWLVLGVSPQAFLADMSMIYRVATGTRAPLRALFDLSIKLILPLLLALGAILATAWVTFAEKRSLSLSTARSLLAAGFLLAADLALGTSNTQLPVLVLLPFIALVALREVVASGDGRSWKVATVISLTFLLSVFPILRETTCFAYAGMRKISVDPSDAAEQRFRCESLKDVFVPLGDAGMSFFPQLVNQGLDLLKKHMHPGDKLVTFSYSDPFHFILGIKPSSGNALYWHYGMNYTAKIHLPPERVFSKADFIMIDKRRLVQVLPIYTDYLNAHYMVIDRSEWWFLLGKRI